MRNRGRTTGMGIRKGLDHVRSPWGISWGKFYAREISKDPRYPYGCSLPYLPNYVKQGFMKAELQ